MQTELDSLRRHYENVQTEKKELEEEFSQLKDNYSLLSSQSKTVSEMTDLFHLNFALLHFSVPHVDYFVFFFLILLFRCVSLTLLFSFHFFFSLGCRMNLLGWPLDVCSPIGRSCLGGSDSF